jgi:hypothetical protein
MMPYNCSCRNKIWNYTRCLALTFCQHELTLELPATPHSLHLLFARVCSQIR